MDGETRKLLNEEIETEFRNLYTLGAGSEEHAKAVEDLAKLYRLKIDEDKIHVEEDVKLTQTMKDWWIDLGKMGVEAMGVILPLMFYAAWMRRGFKFEETGTFTSTTFRGLFSRFRPTGK